MSRKNARQQVGVALFPFLAVLICTMGALIVLLVLLVQQARVDASTIATARSSAADEGSTRQLRERLEDANWRRELLEKSRQEKTTELSQSRSRVAHLEEHKQRLEAEARELLERARTIDEGRQLRAEDLAAAQAEAAQIKAEIERQKTELQKANKNLGSSQDSYALIPYDGRNGTRRRPIYVECTEFGVVVQPEGLLLVAEDFHGPLGPGNPLDMALRAIREHWERNAATQAGQPYPLLVVRPSGVNAFGAARAAIKAWDDEWGYELVSDDLQLDFGAPDPVLAATLSKTASVARQRQAAMISKMPRRYQGEQPLQSFAVPQPASAASQQSEIAGRGIGGRGIGSGTGLGMPGSSANYGATAPGGGATGAAAGAGQSGSLAGSQSATSGAITSGWPSGSASEGPGANSSAGSHDAAVPGATADGRFTGSTSGGGGDSRTANSTSPGAANSSNGNTSSSGTAPGSGSPTSGAQTGIPTPSLNFNTAGQKSPSSGSQAKADKRATANRGKNWALPNAKVHQTGVTRPIKVRVEADRVVVLPEQGDSRPPKVVKIAPELSPDDVSKIVATVQSEVQGWGLAVADGYWKPVLQADVAPGAERHFLNMETALHGSGIDIVRR